MWGHHISCPHLRHGHCHKHTIGLGNSGIKTSHLTLLLIPEMLSSTQHSRLLHSDIAFLDLVAGFGLKLPLNMKLNLIEIWRFGLLHNLHEKREKGGHVTQFVS